MFLRSVVLGGTLGLLYDLIRAVRRLCSPAWGGALDALTAFTAVAALFFFVMAGDGELRLFILMGALGGMILFFCLLSAPLRPIWDFWLSLSLIPLRLAKRVGKKVWKICKKVFSFCESSFTMKMQFLTRRRREKEDETMAQGNTPHQPPQKKRRTSKKRIGGKFAGLVLFLLALAASIQLVSLLKKLQTAKAEEAAYAQRLTVLEHENAQLEEDIASSNDPEMIMNIARDELGMVSPGEKVFRFSD